MKTMDKPIDFQNEIRREMESITPVFRSYPWEDKMAYADFISNLYYFLCHACRLLTAAAARLPVEQDEFHHRFVAHTLEEKNHEKLATADLKGLGLPLMPCRASIPPLWQTQYYMIDYQSPLALFGCIAFMENISVYPELGPWIYEVTEKAYGPKCTNYLRVHIKEDEDHVGKLAEMLAKLPIEAQPIVLDSFRISASVFTNFMNELNRVHGREKTFKNAG